MHKRTRVNVAIILVALLLLPLGASAASTKGTLTFSNGTTVVILTPLAEQSVVDGKIGGVPVVDADVVGENSASIPGFPCRIVKQTGKDGIINYTLVVQQDGVTVSGTFANMDIAFENWLSNITINNIILRNGVVRLYGSNASVTVVGDKLIPTDDEEDD